VNFRYKNKTIPFVFIKILTASLIINVNFCLDACKIKALENSRFTNPIFSDKGGLWDMDLL